MTVAISLMGMAGNVWQLMALRLFVGLAGGYSSGSMVLVATQTPKERSAWALGVLSCGIMAGNLVGPLIGGVLPPVIGIRGTFLAAGAMIFLAFLATALLIKEEKSPARKQAAKASGGWISIPDKGPVVAMLATGALLMFANMSIEPIITVYVAQIVPDATEVTKISGLVMSAAALGSILSASRLGRLADRIGHWPVISGALAVAGLLLIPQAFVTSSWQLIVLRFLMGAALGGLLPCIAAVIRHSVPDSAAGSILGLSVSSQYVGQVAGPILGGFVGGHVGMRAVFLGTAVLLLAGGAYAWIVRPKTTETGAGSASRAAADQFDA
ncbi:MFS transporter, partial [Rhizobium phaseoli]